MTTLMFAYGSNLCLPRLRHRLGELTLVATGLLRNYSYRWHLVSNDGSGKGDAFHTGNPSDGVYGAVFRCSPTQMDTLDQIEGLGEKYNRITVSIETATGSLSAATYVALPHAIVPDALPYDWYKTIVVLGAQSLALPSDYIATLNASPTIPDPDIQRHLCNLDPIATLLLKSDRHETSNSPSTLPGAINHD